MEQNKVRLTIGGIDYFLTTEDDPTYLRDLAEELNESITALLHEHSRLSQVQAAVLCALEYADSLHKTKQSLDCLKDQIRTYMEDAAKARKEAELSRREAERMTGELRSLRRGLEEYDS